jgi:hypothetical protein
VADLKEAGGASLEQAADFGASAEEPSANGTAESSPEASHEAPVSHAEPASPSPEPLSFNPFNPNGKRGRREWTPEQRAIQAERAKGQKKPPFDDDFEAVKADFDAGLPMDAIGRKYGCSGSHIRNFLKKHGIDPRRGAGNHRGREPMPQHEVETIIAEKAKGTTAAEIGEMIGRDPHVVDQKYGALKKAGLVPQEHLTPEALEARKKAQNELVAEKMRAYHAGPREAEEEESDPHLMPEDESEPVIEPAPEPEPANPLAASDWPDVRDMLDEGRSLAAIAGDFDVTVDHLERFIAIHRELDDGEPPPLGKPHAPHEALAVGAN